MVKYVGIISLSLSTIGAVLVGLLAERGIPKKGDIIKAPNRRIAVIGWILIIFGFMLSLVNEVFKLVKN